jgi:hypothetical protein
VSEILALDATSESTIVPFRISRELIVVKAIYTAPILNHLIPLETIVIVSY